jgi:Ser/Thr protein kinase RdoA (MazF antagonist)
MTVNAEIRAAWGWDHDVEIAPLSGGLINATYGVYRDRQPVAVVQRLHPIFGAAVNLDLERITHALATAGLVTPLLVRTVAGAPCIEVEHRVWRALTWVDGVAVHAVPSLEYARAGGELVGQFHRALVDLDYDYAFTRTGVHDTAAHLARLRDRVDRSATVDEAVDLGHAILAAAHHRPPLPSFARRHGHGDLKISNLLFSDGAPVIGRALVDLDTLGKHPLAFELGDAMRSWCNPRGEDAGAVGFDLAIFAAAMAGWREVTGELTTGEERAAVVAGLETVCLELAARFAVDVFDDDYFGWDPTRFVSRRAHNLVRARGQLALAAAVAAARTEAISIAIHGAGS